MVVVQSGNLIFFLLNIWYFLPLKIFFSLADLIDQHQPSFDNFSLGCFFAIIIFWKRYRWIISTAWSPKFATYSMQQDVSCTQTHSIWKEALNLNRQMQSWRSATDNQNKLGTHCGKWEISSGSCTKHWFFWILFILNNETVS